MNAFLNLPPHLKERLGMALKTGQLAAPYRETTLRGLLGAGCDLSDLRDSLSELDKLGMSGEAIAKWIEMLGQVSSSIQKPDVVWSGPEVSGLHARDTRQVYEELLSSAESSIWISTYAFFDGPRAFEVLARRMDACPDLKVVLLLNIQRSKGDTSAADQIVRRFADKFWTTEWPGGSRPHVYYDPRALDDEGPGSVLHAKAVVVDDERAFVTSANLTEAALDRNVELGLLVKDRQLALTIAGHFQVLIDQRLLRALPQD